VGKLRFSAVTSVGLMLTVFVVVAHGGASIGRLGTCPNSYEFLAHGTGSVTDFRASLLCLINEARKSEHLPALKRSAQLERVAQAQSNKFARTGSASHGHALSDIAARFVKAGYHPAAYNEGFDVLGVGATPYLFLSSMLGHAGVPCSEILDPRFRDVGIGTTVSAAGFDTLELGLRAGQRRPSRNARPSASCPHKPAAPVVTGKPVIPGSTIPTATGSTVNLRLHCAARAACALTSTLTLPDARASAHSGTVRIPAGASKAISYTFTANAIKAELAAPNPTVSLSIRVTAPVPYSGTITGPLTRRSAGSAPTLATQPARPRAVPTPRRVLRR
jgi:Cysteine-rich secretory protein family